MPRMTSQVLDPKHLQKVINRNFDVEGGICSYSSSMELI